MPDRAAQPTATPSASKGQKAAAAWARAQGLPEEIAGEFERNAQIYARSWNT